MLNSLSDFIKIEYLIKSLPFVALGVFLYAISFGNYLLFHVLAEFFSILVGFMIFIIAWNSRGFFRYGYIKVLGVGFLFVSSIDLLHTIVYKGMSILESGLFEATQLWIIARYVEAFTLLFAFSWLFKKKKQSEFGLFLSYTLIVAGLLAAVAAGIFPECYNEETGLTLFKKMSEYVIILILAATIYVVRKKKKFFNNTVYNYLIISIVFTIISEACFTLYTDVYGLFNFLGHFFKIVSFWFIFKSIIFTSLNSPQKLIFRDMIIKQQSLLELTSHWKVYKSTVEFIDKLFWYLFYILPEFDSGFVLYKSGETIQVIDAKGYALERLQKLDIPPEELPIPDKTELFSNDSEGPFRLMDDNTSARIKKALKSYKRGLLIPLKSQKATHGAIFMMQSSTNAMAIKDESQQLANFITEFLNMVISIKEQGEEIYTAYRDFSHKLAQVAEAYDEDTGNHIIRVGELSGILAEEMGLPEDKANEIRDYAPLHDVGKIFVPASILNKPGKLNDDEWAEMKKHTVYANRLLSDDSYFQTALKIALYHHEKYNGGGYPDGLVGDDIPIEASIVALVDVYDALRSKRPYKKPFTHEKAFEIITKGDGRTSPTHFNPKVLEAFQSVEQPLMEKWDSLK